VLRTFLQAIGEQEIQSIMRVCSERGSAWLTAHVPDLLLACPGAGAVLDTILPHLGYSQVCYSTKKYVVSRCTALHEMDGRALERQN
jgi:hypothetical protein